MTDFVDLPRKPRPAPAKPEKPKSWVAGFFFTIWTLIKKALPLILGGVLLYILDELTVPGVGMVVLVLVAVVLFFWAVKKKGLPPL